MKRKFGVFGLVFALFLVLSGCGSDTSVIVEDTSNDNKSGEFLTEMEGGRSNFDNFYVTGVQDGRLYVVNGATAYLGDDNYEKGQYINNTNISEVTPSGRVINKKDITYLGGGPIEGKVYTGVGIYDVFKEAYDVEISEELIKKLGGSYSGMFMFATGKENSYVYAMPKGDGMVYAIFENGGKDVYISEEVPLYGGGNKERAKGSIEIAFDKNRNGYVGFKDDGRVYDLILKDGKIDFKEISKIKLEDKTFIQRAYSIGGDVYVETGLEPFLSYEETIVDEKGNTLTITKDNKYKKLSPVIYSLIYFDKSGEGKEVFKAEEGKIGAKKELVRINSLGYAVTREELGFNSKGDKMMYESAFARVTKDGVEKIKTLAKDTEKEYFYVWDFVVNEKEGKIGLGVDFEDVSKSTASVKMYGIKELN